MSFIEKVPAASNLYECLLQDGAAAEERITDWIRQQKKRMLHKLCIDMERSEYTSFSMLAIVKMRVLMDEHFGIALHGFEGMRQSGSARRCSILFFRVPYSVIIFLLL